MQKKEKKKTRLVDFPWGKLAIKSNFRGEIVLYSHFSCRKCYNGKLIVIFLGETTREKSYTLTVAYLIVIVSDLEPPKRGVVVE